MMSQSTGSSAARSVQLGLPSATLPSQNIFQQQSLLQQLATKRAQSDNSGFLTRSIQNELSNLYSPQSVPPQSDASSHRNQTEDLSTANMRIPSSVGEGGSNVTGSAAGSNEAVLLRGPSNADVVATFLARQQFNRNISKHLNNNTNTIASTGQSSTLSLGSALPVPAGVAPSDATRQLLQLMQNRQMNSINNANLAQIEAIIQQQLQQKPQGR
jgi:hypothetical protein